MISREFKILLTRFLMGILFPIINHVYAEENRSQILIKIANESIVHQNYFTLGEIAEFNGFDVKLIQSLSEVRLGRSPLPGKSNLVHEKTIRSRLPYKLKKAAITFIIPEDSIVSRASVKVTKDQIKDIVLSQVHKNFEANAKIKIKFQSKIKDLYLPQGEVSYHIKKIGNVQKRGGYISWEINFKIDEEDLKKLIVRTKVSWVQDVYLAKKKIKRGEKITFNKLKIASKDTSGQKVGELIDMKSLVGKHARRDILPGELIKKNLLESPILIKEGKQVVLIYKTNNLELQTVAKVLKSGRLGQIIPVRNIASKKIIRARVMDSSSVEVVL